MQLDLTFKQVCEFIKKDDPNIIGAVEKLLGRAQVCSPVLIEPATAAVILPVISIANKIVEIGKGVFEEVTTNRDDDYLARQHRMEIAYGLICFTAFFEALDRQISEPLREKNQIAKGRQDLSRADRSKKRSLPIRSGL
ncbi:MAG: hypothetical protein GKC09_08045 [Methanosarcinales archaeon]|nr:hypothetical protein [Methanosarcinales archaeon]